jgi:dTDP-glucose pyrophosphorylase/CBS domain-containing protein
MTDISDPVATQLGLMRADGAIRDAMETIDRSQHKIALVVDGRRRLLGTVTDGDIRRAILAEKGIDRPVSDIMFRTPIILRVGEPVEGAETRARGRQIRKIPILDAAGSVVSVHTVEQRGAKSAADNIVVIMAGGLGKRLRPLTEDTPKPLLPVGEKPLLETIVEQIVVQGFRHIYFAVHYKADMVEAHFGDGAKWNATFRYLNELDPLGTAGALSLLPERPTQPILVMNADLLTKVDLKLLLDYHLENRAMATMGVRAYDFEIPYGVVSTEGYRITAINEKPIQQIFVNAGVYAFDPSVLDCIRPDQRLDMPDLFTDLIAQGIATAAFPIREYWIDVGRLEDLRRANDEYPEEFA